MSNHSGACSSTELPFHSQSGQVSDPSNSFPSTLKSPSSSTFGSPSRRSVPLAKPAPLASLPAIPIAVTTVTESAHTSLIPHRTSSPAPSSAIESVASSMTTRNRKRSSRAASFYSAKTHIEEGTDSLESSSVYRKRRRQDALHALEGFNRASPKASFAPSILPEEDEEDVAMPARSAPPALSSRWWPYRSHLSFGSTVANSSAIFSAASKASVSASRLRSPTTPCFAVGYAEDPSFEPLSRDTEPRRASSDNNKEQIGWGVNFIDLEDDSSSSLWRWSHVA